jgi:hypothetical protein
MQFTGKAWSAALLLAGALAFMPAQSFSQDAVKVAEVKLGKGVQDRRITEEASAFALNEKAYLWLRVTGGAGQAIKVVWRNAELTDAVTLNLGGSPWRTWSSKTLAKSGDWTVTVTDASDQILHEASFTVQ